MADAIFRAARNGRKSHLLRHSAIRRARL